MQYLLVLFYLCLSCSTYACYAPEEEQIADVEVLVKRTKDILLSEVISIEEDNVKFKVIENLRDTPSLMGIIVKYFSVLFEKNENKKEEIFLMKNNNIPYKEGDYNSHKESSFWVNTEGRVNIYPDCTLRPTFKMGKRYLIFNNPPYHFKSFEEVNTNEDEWYRKIKKIIKTMK